MRTDGVTIRRMAPEDRGEVLALMAASHGWSADEDNVSYFEWKHERNPFGTSPSWVAVDEGRLVGFRTFLSWRFEHPDGRTRRAVRAVDTATAPECQGRGIFRQLTLTALEELRDDGIDFVFNTPNEKSRPGYLKMGWSQLGKVRVAARVAGARGATRMLRARVPAERWSIAVNVGLSVDEALADPRAQSAIASRDRARYMRTERTLAFVQWRYSYDRLHYRALPIAKDLGSGFVVFRVRRRGAATEATVCDVIGPARVPFSAVLRDVIRRTGADYAIAADGAGIGAFMVPLLGQGPILTCRPVAGDGVPHLRDFALSLGDVEAL